MKIDAYAHIIPPKAKDFLWKTSNSALDDIKRKVEPVRTIYSLDARFRLMDKYPDRREVLTLAWFTAEDVTANTGEAIELAQRINEEMAELVLKYPDRFVGAAAFIPMRDMDAGLKELDRAINQLNLKGVLLRHPVEGKPIDLPEFLPLYEKMSRYDLPIWLHPIRTSDFADFPTENESKYDIYRTFGLPYETTATMARLVFAGVLQKYPDLKIITHHCGGMVPYYAGRIINHYALTERRSGVNFAKDLNKPLIEYFRKFYNDTAIGENPAALTCAYHFFGADHLLFGHDMPMDAEYGEYGMRQTIKAIEQMDIADAEKGKIFRDNIRKLLRLSI